MFKLVFLFTVLIVVAITASPHPRQNQVKKSLTAQKHAAVHHGRLESHARPAKRVARSQAVHAPVHHGPGAGSTRHFHKNKVTHGSYHGIHGAAHGGGNHVVHGNKGVAHRPLKHRGHRK